MKKLGSGKILGINYWKILISASNYLLYEFYDYIILNKLPWSNINFTPYTPAAGQFFEADYMFWAAILIFVMVFALYIPVMGIYLFSAFIFKSYLKEKMHILITIFVPIFYILLFPIEYLCINMLSLLGNSLSSSFFLNAKLLTPVVFILASIVEEKFSLFKGRGKKEAWSYVMQKILNLILATFIVGFTLIILAIILQTIIGN